MDRRLLDDNGTTAAAIAAAAAVATAVATAMAAAIAVMTTVAATARAAAIAVAAATMTEGRSLVLTAHEGDSNQCEKDRNTQNDDTIHSQILQLLTGTVSENNQFAVRGEYITATDGPVSRRDPALQRVTSFKPEAKSLL